MVNITILERLEMAAAEGEYDMVLCLWKRSITSLKKKGLDVKILNKIEDAKYACRVSWKDASPAESGETKNNTIANNLWLMARSANS